MRGEEAPDLGGEGLLVSGVREVHERSGLYPVPQREAGGREVLVEADDVPARERFHDREADGIGVGDGTRRHALDPATRRCMVIRRRKMNRDALAGVDTFERPERGLDAGPEERQAMGLGDDEVGGDQWNSGPESFAEETIRLGMVLVAPAAQRDPAAAIDEQPSGSGGGAGGTVPAVRRRTSRAASGP